MITRYKRNFGNLFDVSQIQITPFEIDFGDSVVDKTHFRPSLDNLDSFNSTASCNNIGKYDFPDGKDIGLRVTQLRNLGADITEIQASLDAIKKATDEQKSTLVESLKKQVQEAEVNAALNDPANTVTENASKANNAIAK